MWSSVEFEGLSKRYRVTRKGTRLKPKAIEPGWRREGRRQVQDVWALRDVNLRVEAGTILGIVGPNGAGKSTMLKTLARVTPPTEGRAVVRGRVVSLLGLGDGFHPDLTGRENVELNAALHGIPRAIAQRRFDQIVSFAELDDFIDIAVKRYSSGMYLRLAFSVAVNLDPDILLADEVLAVGDVAFQERCLQRIEQLGAAGRTVLLVSHDMGAVVRLCNRVVWLSGGRIVEDGEPETVVAHYEDAALSGAGLPDPQAPGEPTTHGRMLTARVEDAAGNPLRDARVTDELFVRMTFRIDTPGAAFRCGLRVMTEGLTAFRAIAPDKQRSRDPDTYTARARIPPDLLADRSYVIRPHVVVTGDGASAKLEPPDPLTVRVHEVEDSGIAGTTSKGELKGVVRPRLDWRIDPTAGAATGEPPTRQAVSP
jgi:lipopolysaccharide transport system ATP-binding protein